MNWQIDPWLVIVYLLASLAFFISIWQGNTANENAYRMRIMTMLYAIVSILFRILYVLE